MKILPMLQAQPVTPLVTLVDPSTVNDNPLQPPGRAHDDAVVKSLKASIERDGQRVPSVVGGDNYLLDGHRRKKVAELLKRQLLVMVHPDLTYLDWGKLNAGTKTISGAEWLHVFVQSKGAAHGIPNKTLSECRECLQILGGYAQIQVILLDNGLGPALVRQVRQAKGHFANNQMKSPSDLEIMRWIAGLSQTRALEVFLAQLADGNQTGKRVAHLLRCIKAGKPLSR